MPMGKKLCWLPGWLAGLLRTQPLRDGIGAALNAAFHRSCRWQEVRSVLTPAERQTIRGLDCGIIHFR